MNTKLVLSRRLYERIVIQTSDGPIVVEVCQLYQRRCKLAIMAPEAVKVYREELLAKGEQP
jgi:carbon storage regulator CsrA